ncbi:MAG TPA: phosphatase PAP2 family protein [Burkholderiales bacterium]|nr:phosphatase PAP2 family protein [Burkholderiales bacterium]
MRDLLVLAVIGAAITLLFANGALDLAAARLFYSPGENHWPLGGELPWSFLYKMAPWVTASLVLGAMGALALGVVRKREAWRREATLVLLTLVLGPGLLVNGVLKDHWNRPRPRDLVEFGGPWHYVAAPLRGEGGKSFPCGHCSVGFLYGVGWWIWRRQRPRLAAGALVVGVVVGTALGIERIAAGGHFPSDVIWSAYIALGLAHILHSHPITIPRRALAMPLVAGVGGVCILLALSVMPHGTAVRDDIPLAMLEPRPQVFALSAKVANVNIVLVDAGQAVSVAGELHGFGLPTSHLAAGARYEPGPVPTLRYAIAQQGWFTDLDASLTVRLPAAGLQQVVVRLDRGAVKVTDATRAKVVATGAVKLDLETASSDH